MREPEFTQAKWGFMYVGEGRIYITFDGQEFPGEREIDYDSVDVLADEIKADDRHHQCLSQNVCSAQEFCCLRCFRQKRGYIRDQER